MPLPPGVPSRAFSARQSEKKNKRWHSVLWVRQLDERRRRLWLLPAEIGVGRVTTVNDTWPAPCTPTTLTIGIFLLKLFIIGQITSYVICSATVTTVNDTLPAPCTPTPLTIGYFSLKIIHYRTNNFLSYLFGHRSFARDTSLQSAPSILSFMSVLS